MDTRLNCFSMLSHYDCVILDTETTGLDLTAEIIEISLINLRGEILVNTLVKPRNPIPMSATNIHGITDEMVKNAPSWEVVWPWVQQAIQGKLVVIYNASFDIRMLMQSSEHAGVMLPERLGAAGFFCAMLEYSHWHNEYDVMRVGNRWISLSRAVRQEGLQVINAHRALADCQMTLAVIQSVTRKIAMVKFGIH